MTARSQGGVLLFLPWVFDMLGGVDVVVDRLWHGLERTHPGVGTIGVQDWHQSGGHTDADGRRFLHLNLPAPEAGASRWNPRYAITLLRRLPAARRLLAEHDIRVVNFHFPRGNVYPLALMKQLGLWRGRIVLSFHGSDVREVDPRSPFWQQIAAETDEVTACSRALAGQVEALGLFKGAVRVVHNGIDCDKFVADDAPLPVAGRYILNVGNYVAGKAQDVLVDAFAQIAPAHPDLNLVFIGGTLDGTWLAGLRDKVAKLGLGERVVFLENQPQKRVARLMRFATALAHASRAESFGLVLIEAGVCGTPVVATRVGGIPEIIPSQEFGVLVEVGDVAALATALDDLLRRPDEAAARAGRLQTRVLNTFSVTAMTQGYLSVLSGQP